MPTPIADYHDKKITDFMLKLCKPLKQNYNLRFRYYRRYHDDRTIILSDWLETLQFFYDSKQYQVGFLDSKPFDFYQSGKIITALSRKNQTNMEKELDSKLKRATGWAEGVAFLQRHEEYVEVFGFSSQDYSVYSHQKELFQQFLYYFKQEANDLIHALEKNPYKINRDYIKDKNLKTNGAIILNSKEKPSKDHAYFPVKRYYLIGLNGETYLTQQEIECLEWLIQGKTAEETAIIKSVSKKTIENHFTNMRNKLGCSNKYQLIKLIVEQKLI